MKRKICAALALLAVFSCLFATQKAQKAADPKGADGYAYVVKAYNGMVAVFQKGSNLPDEVLDCPLDSLPQEDAQRLIEGIPVADEQELQRLIEAFD